MPTILTLPADWHRTVEDAVRDIKYAAAIRDATVGPRKDGRVCTVIICMPDDTVAETEWVLRAVLTPPTTQADGATQ